MVPRGKKRTPSPRTLSWAPPVAPPLSCPSTPVAAAQADSCSGARQHLTSAALSAFCPGSTNTRQRYLQDPTWHPVPALWKCTELTRLGTHSFFGLSDDNYEVLSTQSPIVSQWIEPQLPTVVTRSIHPFVWLSPLPCPSPRGLLLLGCFQELCFLGGNQGNLPLGLTCSFQNEAQPGRQKPLLWQESPA